MNNMDKICVTKTFLPPIEEYFEEIKSIWENKWVTNNGELHMEFEESINTYLGVENTTLFCNGHMALDIAIKALKLKGEVITTPFSFASTTHAITLNNLQPVFCDINLEDYTIDCDKIEALITEKTSAIIPVHVYGKPCNTKKIEEIAKKYNLKVIYDAAHCFGVEIDGKGIGTFGDISMFSFHATKVFNSIEGGALTYGEEYLKYKLNKLKNFGISGEEVVDEIGLNAKMNEFQAAIGLINLRYINKEIEKRKDISRKYKEELKQIDGIEFGKEKINVKYNYAYFPIIIDEVLVGITRDELYDQLKKYNIYTRKYFYPLITEYDCYKDVYANLNIENAKYISKRVLALPIYGDLSEVEVDYIIKSIKKIIDGKR